METYLVRLARRRGRGEGRKKKGDNPSYRKKRGKLLMVYIIITGYLTLLVLAGIATRYPTLNPLWGRVLVVLLLLLQHRRGKHRLMRRNRYRYEIRPGPVRDLVVAAGCFRSHIYLLFRGKGYLTRRQESAPY